MLETLFPEIYDKFKLNFYKNIFKGFNPQDENLTITESFCLEVIYSLNNPTISALSKYLGISQPNTTYKINELIQKGYVEKRQDPKDKRRVRLYLTERFNSYYSSKNQYVTTVIARMREKFTKEQIQTLEYVLQTMSDELMPEVSLKGNK
ncbi:MAG: MarR family transcriptional regulator [Eubacteriales bacterium]|nr:MarR family transcriptional regulator [Eubacteriales bacterium]